MGKRLGSLFHKPKTKIDSDSFHYVFEYELNNSVEHKSSIQFVPHSCFNENPSDKDLQSFFDFSSAFQYGESSTFCETKHDPQYRTIFTYSESLQEDLPYTTKLESAFRQSYKKNDTTFSSFLIFLSTILLLLFLPILCWMFIKKLSKNERLIIIRLGRRLCPKGPGWVVILPFCDNYHRILLDEQNVKIKKVSGGTKDEALLEITASVTFRLVEVEMAYSLTTQSPNQLVTGQGQLCLLSSLSKIMWRNQLADRSYQDLQLETMTSLGCRCGRHGIQIINVNIDEVHLIRDAPSVETVGKRQSLMIGQHLRVLSELIQTSTKVPSANNATAVNEMSFGNDVAGTTSGRSSTSTVASMVSHPSGAASGDNVKQSECSGSPKISSDVIQARKSICSSAIARAQPFLRNSVACRALDYASLQLKVYASRHEIQENCGDADDPELVYFDAGSNRADMGLLSGSKPPNVTVYIGYEELGEVLSGRLDLMNALNSGLCRVVGDRMLFSKMRYLLYLQR